MATVYVKKQDAEGKDVFEEVQVETLDVREHPEYKKVLDEAIKNRKKVTELKKTFEHADDEGSGEPTKPTTAPVAPQPQTPAEPAPKVPTLEELADELEKRQAAKAKKANEVKIARDTEVQAALTKHGLPQSAFEIVNNSLNIEAMAASLAKAPLQFAETPVGSEDTITDMDSFFHRIDARLFPDGEKRQSAGTRN